MRRFLAIAALAVLLAGCREEPTSTPSSGEPEASAGRPMAAGAGAQAPDFILPDVQGRETVQLSQLKGQVVLVDFWATWCGPCRMEIPSLAELHQEYKKKGFQVVGVSVDQAGSEAVAAFVKQWRIPYPVVMDKGELSAAYGNINAIPHTFLVGKDGRIIQDYEGFHEKAAFEKDIRAALEVKG